MANYYHLYTNSPTAGAQDGTIVSENRLMTSPISVVLDATQAESKVIKCAIRCEEGFESYGDTIIQPNFYNGSEYVASGGNVDKWKVAADLSTAGQVTITITDNAVKGDTITIGDVALTAGTDFMIGTTIKATTENLVNAFNAKSKLYGATFSDAVITIKESYPGAGNTPSLVKITSTGDSADKLTAVESGKIISHQCDEAQVALEGAWADTLTIHDKIRTGNYIFWVKALSTTDELPQRDDTVAIHTKIVVQAV